MRIVDSGKVFNRSECDDCSVNTRCPAYALVQQAEDLADRSELVVERFTSSERSESRIQSAMWADGPGEMESTAREFTEQLLKAKKDYDNSATAVSAFVRNLFQAATAAPLEIPLPEVVFEPAVEELLDAPFNAFELDLSVGRLNDIVNDVAVYSEQGICQAISVDATGI